MVKKREDYISWDEYFMGVALLAAKRSKDPNTQVGACIVDKNNVILTTGYNGFPKGCCNECAKAIIQSGIKEVIYLSDKYADTPATQASKLMLKTAGVKLKQMEPELDELVLDFRVAK